MIRPTHVYSLRLHILNGRRLLPYWYDSLLCYFVHMCFDYICIFAFKWPVKTFFIKSNDMSFLCCDFEFKRENNIVTSHIIPYFLQEMTHAKLNIWTLNTCLSLAKTVYTVWTNMDPSQYRITSLKHALRLINYTYCILSSALLTSPLAVNVFR